MKNRSRDLGVSHFAGRCEVSCGKSIFEAAERSQPVLNGYNEAVKLLPGLLSVLIKIKIVKYDWLPSGIIVLNI